MLHSTLNHLYGCVDLHTCDAVFQFQHRASCRLHTSHAPCAGSGSVQIEEVDVATPKGKVLARRLSAAVRPGEGLLVTGPNGSGAWLS